MKMNKRMVSLLVLGLACLMVAPGCRKTKKGTGVDDNVVGGLRSTELGDMGEYGLDMRLDEYGMTPYPGEFAPVYFDSDSARMQSGARTQADAVVREMNTAPTAQLVVEGHCAERGDRDDNLALGERRALAVRASLIELGIVPGRLTT